MYICTYIIYYSCCIILKVLFFICVHNLSHPTSPAPPPRPPPLYLSTQWDQPRCSWTVFQGFLQTSFTCLFFGQLLWKWKIHRFAEMCSSSQDFLAVSWCACICSTICTSLRPVFRYVCPKSHWLSEVSTSWDWSRLHHTFALRFR